MLFKSCSMNSLWWYTYPQVVLTDAIRIDTSGHFHDVFPPFNRTFSACPLTVMFSIPTSSSIVIKCGIVSVIFLKIKAQSLVAGLWNFFLFLFNHAMIAFLKSLLTNTEKGELAINRVFVDLDLFFPT